MQNPRLSIITVVYNRKNDLQNTIDSVQQQTFKDFEHLIIDGASTDGTLDIIKANGDKARYISEPDKGLYDAMNKGIKMAHGDYIVFMNAGDQFYSNRSLESLFANSKHEDLLYSRAVFLDENGNEKPWHKPTPPAHKISYKSFINGAVINHQSMVIKREKALPYDLQWKIVSDLDWSIRCLKNCNSFHYYDDKFCKFQEGGLSDKRRMFALKERLRLFIKHFGLLRTILQHVIIIVVFVIKRLRPLTTNI